MLLKPYFLAMALAVSASGVALDVSPAPSKEMSLRGPAEADPAMVERGRYLATAGDCVSCHTRPGGEPLSGGLAMTTDFGTIYAPNITPDTKTGIGGWTLEQFSRAMRQGLDPQGRHLYPVFPYTSFTKVTDEDTAAIFMYLMSLKPVSYAAPANDMKFPFSVRELLFFWKRLYLREGQFRPDATKTAEWNRGAYLIEGLGHCGECHTPRNILGGSRSSLALTGGTYLDLIADSVEGERIVKEDLTRRWTAVNLTPSPSGLGAWSLDDIQRYLKTGDSERAGAHGPMKEVIGNSTSHLTAEDIRAMAVYLKSLKPKSPAPIKPGNPDLIHTGEIVYTARCGNCHLPTGLGMPRNTEADLNKVTPPLAGDAIVQAPDPSSLINQILYGSHSESWGGRPWPKMPGFQYAIGFDDDQIAALCTYVRSAWGNRAGACAADEVDRQR